MDETVATGEPVKKRKGRPASAHPRCEICHIYRHKCRHGKEEQEAAGRRKEDEPEPAAAASAKDNEEEEGGSNGRRSSSSRTKVALDVEQAQLQKKRKHNEGVKGLALR